MNHSISNRHEGLLGGTLLPFGETNAAGVTVIIQEAVASWASTQHTAWMLLNLLCRCVGIVGEVSLICPSGIPLAGNVVPIAPEGMDLRASLLASGRKIGAVHMSERKRLEKLVVIGPTAVPEASFYLWGAGWCGGISRLPIDEPLSRASSPLPFGPYMAACAASSQIFKEARLAQREELTHLDFFYSLWSHKALSYPHFVGPTHVSAKLDTSLAGVGAVGCAFLHSLWATPNVSGSLSLIDNDRDGVDATNLNRYVLFGADDLGRPKATAAAQVLKQSSFTWHPMDVAVESVQIRPTHWVSAVDKNAPRHAIQLLYPARIFSASTYDLRAEVLRCGPPGVGACLRCYNPPERVPPDEVLRQQLRSAPLAQQERLARMAGLTIHVVHEWLSTPKCGHVGERILPLLHETQQDPQFSVGFVSVLAGAMLAAELLKDSLCHAVALSDTSQRAVFQFLSPLARTNRAAAYLRDSECPMCAPQSIACKMWAERFHALDIVPASPHPSSPSQLV